MGIVIPFVTPNSKQLVLASISRLLLNEGLSEQKIQAVVAELEDRLEPLFLPRSFEFELPEDLQLTEDQIKGVVASQATAFDHWSAAYAKDIGYAVCVIAGLAARPYFE